MPHVPPTRSCLRAARARPLTEQDIRDERWVCDDFQLAPDPEHVRHLLARIPPDLFGAPPGTVYVDRNSWVVRLIYSVMHRESLGWSYVRPVWLRFADPAIRMALFNNTLLGAHRRQGALLPWWRDVGFVHGLVDAVDGMRALGPHGAAEVRHEDVADGLHEALQSDNAAQWTPSLCARVYGFLAEPASVDFLRQTDPDVATRLRQRVDALFDALQWSLTAPEAASLLATGGPALRVWVQCRLEGILPSEGLALRATTSRHGPGGKR